MDQYHEHWKNTLMGLDFWEAARLMKNEVNESREFGLSAHIATGKHLSELCSFIFASIVHLIIHLIILLLHVDFSQTHPAWTQTYPSAFHSTKTSIWSSFLAPQTRNCSQNYLHSH